MSIWKVDIEVGQMNAMAPGSMLAATGIEFTERGPDFLKARMPVDERTKQPFGILHGGASLVLAETVGSAAAQMCVDPERQTCVGLDINANHLKSVRGGFVYATGTPIHIGKRTQVWQIFIHDEEDDQVCIARLTVAVLDKKQ